MRDEDAALVLSHLLPSPASCEGAPEKRCFSTPTPRNLLPLQAWPWPAQGHESE